MSSKLAIALHKASKLVCKLRHHLEFKITKFELPSFVALNKHKRDNTDKKDWPNK
jgi:hypothetical protein